MLDFLVHPETPSPQMSPAWSLERGARLLSDGAVRFSVWAPRSRYVRIRICNGPAVGEHELTRDDAHDGVFAATIADVGAGADYHIVLADGRALPDPVSRWQPDGVHGPSRVVDPAAMTWTDDGWRGVTMPELVVYELHVGTFTPEGTFAAVVPRLAALRALGVTAIELMPVAQFPGERNWGYDGVDLYAVQNSYGGPYELMKLVDAAHAVGMGVLLDVVYNHVGPEGNYLDAFGPYFTEKYKTPWGRALNYDDAHSDVVRRFVVENALHWIAEYHVDGLRLDAVHGIFDFSATHLVREIAEEVHAHAALAGRSVVVIGESDLNDPRLIRTPDAYGYGLDAQWSDDFHHAVHAMLTGERAGYYMDYACEASPEATVADVLREPFVLDGRYSAFRKRRHGASSVGLPRQRFVVAVQNHDQTGNRAAGERLATLVSPAQRRLAAALLLLSPYTPLMFMGEEYGETNPFLYFVDHGDDRLVDAVRQGRREEFESFGWGADVPDPKADDTFVRSQLDWGKAERAPHSQLLALYRDLLSLRREEPMLQPDGARISVENGAPGWITVLREPADEPGKRLTGETEAILASFNCSPQRIDVPVPGSDVRAWSVRLSTDAAGYGGSGAAVADIPPTVAPDEPRRLLSDAGPGAVRRTVSLAAWSAAVFVSVAA